MRRNTTLALGVLLCMVGALIALSPGPGALAAFLTRYWPFLPLGLGAAGIAGFALKRWPRSAVWPALLLIFGGLGLAITLQQAATPLALYGQLWPLLLGVVALVEIVKHYTGSPALGERPAIVSPGKLLLVGLIVVTGIGASKLAAADSSLLARVSMPPGFDRLRDQLLGEEIEFTPILEAAPLSATGTLEIANRSGDVSIEGGDLERVEVTLTPRVRAYDRASAERAVGRLRLSLAQTANGISVSTNRDAIDRDVETNLKVRVPRGARLQISQAHGAISISGVSPGGGITIQASHAPIALRDVGAAVDVTSAFGAIRVEETSGALDVRGRNDVTVRGFAGTIRLEDSDSVSLADVHGTIDLVSVDHASVSVENVDAGDAPAPGVSPVLVSVDGIHTSVKLKNVAGDARVKTSHDAIRATDVAGTLEIDADHSDVEVTRVGALRVRTSYDSVRARDVRGDVSVENDHGSVSVSEFKARCTVRTSFDDVRVEAARDQTGDVSLENEHGRIDLRLPVGNRYAIDPTVENGETRIDSAFARAVGASDSAYKVILKTTYDDIVVRAV